MDKLRHFLNGLTPTAQDVFASACGTTRRYLRKALNVRPKFGAELCIAIERESGGAVRCEDLVPGADWDFIRKTFREVA